MWYIVRDGNQEREDTVWTALIHKPIDVQDSGLEVTQLGLNVRLDEDLEALICESVQNQIVK